MNLVRRCRYYLAVEWWRGLPVIRLPRIIHLLTRGTKGQHSLEGGWCPLCGSVYDYESHSWGLK